MYREVIYQLGGNFMKKIYLGVIGLTAMLGLAGCKSETKVVETTKSSSATSSQQVSSSSEKVGTVASSETTKAVALSDFKVSLEDAIKGYQKEYPKTDITSIDVDTSFGTYYYKIEGMDDSKKYEVKINVESGVLEKEREETLDKDEQNGVERKKDKLDLTDLISLSKAAEIAVKQVGSGEATEWKLDKDMGTTYWEVTVGKDNNKTEIKMNAKTGDILEVEKDD